VTEWLSAIATVVGAVVATAGVRRMRVRARPRSATVTPPVSDTAWHADESNTGAATRNSVQRAQLRLFDEDPPLESIRRADQRDFSRKDMLNMLRNALIVGDDAPELIHELIGDLFAERKQDSSADPREALAKRLNRLRAQAVGQLPTEEVAAVVPVSAQSMDHALAMLFIQLGPPPESTDNHYAPASNGGGGAQQ